MTVTEDTAALIKELREWRDRGAPWLRMGRPTGERVVAVLEALEASEAARANLEAVIASTRDALKQEQDYGLRIDAALFILAFAGDPVVLRERDAQVLRVAADAWEAIRRGDVVSLRDIPETPTRKQIAAWLRARADAIEKSANDTIPTPKESP